MKRIDPQGNISWNDDAAFGGGRVESPRNGAPMTMGSDGSTLYLYPSKRILLLPRPHRGMVRHVFGRRPKK
jgi:hypothetical protein